MGVEEKCNGSTRDDELELTEGMCGECVEMWTGHDCDKSG